MGLLLVLPIINFIVPSAGDLQNIHIDTSPFQDYEGSRADGSSLWWPLIRLVFKKAMVLQVVSLPAFAGSGVFWSRLLPIVHSKLNIPVITWGTSGNSVFVRDVYNRSHYGSEEGRYFLLMVAPEFLDRLTEADVWFTRGKYVVFVETNEFFQKEVCSQKFTSIARRLWNAHRVAHACVVVSSCAEYVSMFDPYLAGGEDIVYDANNLTNLVTLWTRTFNDLRNFTWKVALVPRFPTAHKVPCSKQKRTNIEGIDGFFLEAVSQHYNIWPVIIPPPDGETYGVFKNGNATGTLGVVVRGEADIAINGRFLIDYGTDDIGFTVPYLTDELCLMAPRAKKVPGYISLFRAYDKTTWAMLLLSFVTISAIWSVFLRCIGKSDHLRASYHVYLMMFAGVIAPSVPHSRSSRIFMTSCLFFSIVFMGGFQGLMYRAISSPMYYPELNTLEDVDRSGLPVATGSDSLKDLFPKDGGPLMQRLRSKFIIVHGDAAKTNLMKDFSKYTSVWRKNDAFRRLFEQSDMKQHLVRHLVEECPRFYFLSFIAPKTSPFLPLLNTFIIRCYDHGLLHFWQVQTFKASHFRKMQKQMNSKLPVIKVDLKQVKPPFYLFLSGISFSILTFIIEKIYSCWRKKTRRKMSVK